MDRPLISVIIPTFERAPLLRRCLRALLRQTLAPDAYEIVVVDNDSADDTKKVVERVAAGRTTTGAAAADDSVAECAAAAVAPPSIRYVLEKKRGLSRAKNAGAEAALGEIVAYIDDDALACPDWLQHIADGFERTEPRPHVIGGPAFPLLMGDRPGWFLDRYETASWGDVRRHLARGEYFYGLNVAFRRDLLLQVGGFDPALGMRGSALGFAEDAEVFERLWAAADDALISLYLPQAYVMHLIPDARVDPFYRMKRSFVVGQTRALREAGGAKRPRPHAVPRAAYSLARAVFGSVRRRPVTRPPARRAHPANWMVEQGTTCAERLGYLGGTVGLYSSVRRSH